MPFDSKLLHQHEDKNDVPRRFLDDKERADQRSHDTHDHTAQQERAVPRKVPDRFAESRHEQSFLHALFALFEETCRDRDQRENDHQA